jgi:hypothetical protein
MAQGLTTHDPPSPPGGAGGVDMPLDFGRSEQASAKTPVFVVGAVDDFEAAAL